MTCSTELSTAEMEIWVWAARSMGMEIIFKKEEKCYIWKGEDDSLSSVQRQFKVLVGYFNNCTILYIVQNILCIVQNIPFRMWARNSRTI